MRIVIAIPIALAAGYLANKTVDWWGVDQGIEFVATLVMLNMLWK